MRRSRSLGADDAQRARRANQQRRSARAVVDVAVAVAGGALWAACFGPTERVLLPWIALAPLIWLLGRPRAPLLGSGPRHGDLDRRDSVDRSHAGHLR